MSKLSGRLISFVGAVGLLIIAAAVIFKSTCCAEARDRSFSISSQHGPIEFRWGKLFFRGAATPHQWDVFSEGQIAYRTTFGNTDVILLNTGFTAACPGQYVYLTVTASGVKPTDSFGTCVETEVKPIAKDNRITFEMPTLEDNDRIVEYTYSSGRVTSRPILQRGKRSGG